MTPTPADLSAAIARGDPVRCMGCNTTRRWGPGQAAAMVYTPRDPRHPWIAYCACIACLRDPKRRARLFRWVETRARAEAEARQGDA